MLTSSYHLPVEEAYHLALELELSFQGIFISKARGSVLSVRDMDNMIISAPRRVDIIISCLMMMLTTRVLLRMSTFLLRY